MVQPQSITQLAMFDYTALDTETRIVVQQRTTEIKALMKRAASDIIEIGQKLKEVQHILGYGPFDGWLKVEFEWSRRTAYNFIGVAEQFGCANFAQLNIAASALYLLAAPSTPDSARHEAIERAAAGEPITHQAAREIVISHKPPREIVIPSAPENEDLIGDGIDDALDPPIEPALARDLGRTAPMITPPTSAPTTQPLAVHFTSNSPEWYTPEKVIRLVIDVLGQIDLDPCSNSDDSATANVPARRYYTAATNGLAARWFGNVYMNPPYGDEIPPWIEKIVISYTSREITQGIALVPGRIDTAWFQPLWDYPLCFVRGRLRFSGADNSAPFPSVLAYFGPDNDLFMDVFEEIGRCGVLK